MKATYVIQGLEHNEPNNYFVAWHGYTPFFSSQDKARRFTSRQEAEKYAIDELFTSWSAFRVINRQN